MNTLKIELMAAKAKEVKGGDAVVAFNNDYKFATVFVKDCDWMLGVSLARHVGLKDDEFSVAALPQGALIVVSNP